MIKLYIEQQKLSLKLLKSPEYMMQAQLKNENPNPDVDLSLLEVDEEFLLEFFFALLDFLTSSSTSGVE